MRGEHHGKSMKGAAGPGASPRARGAPPGSAPGRFPERSIPACAGSTPAGPIRAQSRVEHPRVRGEHRLRRLLGLQQPGASPRARGARRAGGCTGRSVGSIPACAGSTHATSVTSTLRREHPRVRGEHFLMQGGVTSAKGASPRARGALEHNLDEPLLPGSIPACAGSTTPPLPTSRLAREHPRVRGEHSVPGRRPSMRRGASPRARGAPGMAENLGPVIGSIPACAGSTGRRGRRPPDRREHPRVRGEHKIGVLHFDRHLGASPRARGALCLTWGFMERLGRSEALLLKRTFRVGGLMSYELSAVRRIWWLVRSCGRLVRPGVFDSCSRS